MFFLLLLILPGVRTQEAHPNQLPRTYQHPFSAVQFVQHKPTRKGPILFPNDAPPAPPTPLIVTSRPLSESIARSELNPNNSLPAQSQYHQVSLKPSYLARTKNYQPYAYTLATVTPAYDYESSNYDHRGQNRKDAYQYEKHLMEIIHQRRNTEQEHNLWNEPLQRRGMLQERREQNARKTIFADAVKSNENDDDFLENDQYSVGDDMFRFPRSSVEENVHRQDIVNKKPETSTYYANETNDGADIFHRRQYINENIIRKVQQRPYYSLNKLNSNDRVHTQTKHISRIGTELKVPYRNVRDEPPDSVENSYQNERDDLRNMPRRTISKIRNDKRHSYSTEIQSNEESSIVIRPYHRLDDLSDNTHRMKRIRVTKSIVDATKPNKRKVISNEDQSEGVDKLIDLHTYHYPAQHLKIRKTTPDSIENFSRNYERILMGGSLLSTENFDDNLEKHVEKNIMLAFTTPEEQIQNTPELHNILEEHTETPKRENTLYRLTDDVHIETQPPTKPERFTYQAKSPKPYYAVNDGKHDNSKEYNHGENYAFSYTVKDHKTGDDFSHSQHSTGASTNGEYRVRLPDGRMQIVSYTADENGYKADVRYDDHHNQDNSIDVETSRENRYKNDNLHRYKNDYINNYKDHLDNRDSLDNGDYIQQRFEEDKAAHYNFDDIPKPPTFIPKHHKNLYLDHTTLNDFAHKKDYHTKSIFVDTTKVKVNEHKDGGLTDGNNDYLEQYNDKIVENSAKLLRTHDDDYYQFTEEVPLTKEIMDYSSEFGQDYEPHKSKFSSFHENEQKTKLTPTYDELKDLFVTKPNGRKNAEIPVISTDRPDDVTPDVVIITPKPPNLYTNIKNLVSSSPYTFTTPPPSLSTPRSYLLSTIANLKHQINLANKPVLSHQYIDKINKYLSYK